MAQVIIKNGTYRNKDVTGTFELVKPWKASPSGSFVTVVSNGSLEGAEEGKNARVKVAFEDVEQIGELAASVSGPNGTTTEPEIELNETDEQTISRITKTFNYIDTLTAAAQRNQITGLIISGPAGIGKSYGVEQTLERMNMTRVLKGIPERFDILTGGTSAIALYIKLWENRKAGQVLIFDDCDSALRDELQLNLLKAAMDSKKKRKICWIRESNALRGNGDEEGESIPDNFLFEGSIVFLTNIKFDQCRVSKIAPHLEAIMSRVHYLDLCLDTRREQLLRVKQVVGAGMLDDRDLGKKLEERVVNYVYDNVDYLKELSLRTVLKVADLAAVYADTWEEAADMTCLSDRGRKMKWAAEYAEQDAS